MVIGALIVSNYQYVNSRTSSRDLAISVLDDEIVPNGSFRIQKLSSRKNLRCKATPQFRKNMATNLYCSLCFEKLVG